MSKHHTARNSAHKRKLKSALFGRRLKAPCCFCSVPLTIDSATLEHLIPLSLGGKWILANCSLSCNACNNERGNADFNEFRDWKRGIAKTRPSMGNVTNKIDLNTLLDDLSSEFKKDRLPD